MDNKTATPAKAKSIDEVLNQLDDIIRSSVENKNYLCLFAHVYRETTAAIQQAIIDNQFEDGLRMEKMDVYFANLYIEAYYNEQNEKEIPACWKYAFSNRNEALAAIQQILLGMNAHINHDLAIAAAHVSKGKQIIALKRDFMTVNSILANLTNEMQKGLGKISLFMKLLDFVGFRNDEKVINFSIRKARDFAWLNAMELALLSTEQQINRITEIDKRVLEISKMVKNPPGRLLSFILRLISAFETKEPARIIEKMKSIV